MYISNRILYNRNLKATNYKILEPRARSVRVFTNGIPATAIILFGIFVIINNELYIDC